MPTPLASGELVDFLTLGGAVPGRLLPQCRANAAAYYNGEEWLAFVSWTSDFFILGGKECKGTRPATASELQQFKNLIAFDPKQDIRARQSTE